MTEISAIREAILDIYPFLAIKRGAELLDRIPVSLSWVPEQHKRRLEAYTVLAAYTANLSRLVRKEPDPEIHEYGDANFVCTAMSNAVIGDEARIIAPESPEIERWFRQWADNDLFFPRLVANEYKASNLGDCVYRLNYSRLRKRTQIRTLDPGHWFPLNIGRTDEQHIFAWEEKNPRSAEVEIYREWYRRDTTAGGPGQVSLTATYHAKGTGGDLTKLDTLRFAKNEDGEVLDNAALSVPFFPIIWIPNIFREGWEFGESDLTAVWRVLDQLANTYTDEGANAYLLGLAQMWVQKETMDTIPVNEKGEKHIRVGKGQIVLGPAGVVDNSTLNQALIEYQHELEDKLYTNTFLGPLGTGRFQTGSGDRTTGIFQLKGGPLERFVSVKRMLRSAKYAKLLRFIAQFEVQFGNKLFTGEPSQTVATIQFGNILPIDQTALIDNIEKIKGNLSREDLRDNLREAGLTINQELVEPTTQAQTQTRTGAQE